MKFSYSIVKVLADPWDGLLHEDNGHVLGPGANGNPWP